MPTKKKNRGKNAARREPNDAAARREPSDTKDDAVSVSRYVEQLQQHGNTKGQLLEDYAMLYTVFIGRNQGPEFAYSQRSKALKELEQNASEREWDYIAHVMSRHFISEPNREAINTHLPVLKAAISKVDTEFMTETVAFKHAVWNPAPARGEDDASCVEFHDLNPRTQDETEKFVNARKERVNLTGTFSPAAQKSEATRIALYPSYAIPYFTSELLALHDHEDHKVVAARRRWQYNIRALEHFSYTLTASHYAPPPHTPGPMHGSMFWALPIRILRSARMSQMLTPCHLDDAGIRIMRGMIAKLTKDLLEYLAQSPSRHQEAYGDGVRLDRALNTCKSVLIMTHEHPRGEVPHNILFDDKSCLELLEKAIEGADEAIEKEGHEFFLEVMGKQSVTHTHDATASAAERPRTSGAWESTPGASRATTTDDEIDWWEGPPCNNSR